MAWTGRSRRRVGPLAAALAAACLVGVLSDGAAGESASWDELMGWARSAREAGSLGEAESALVAALERAEGFGPSDARLAETLTALAGVRASAGKSEAAALVDQALEAWERVHGRESRAMVDPLVELAGAYVRSGRPIEAQQLLDRALGLLDTAGEGETAEAERVLAALAEVYRGRKRMDELTLVLHRLRGIAEKRYGPRSRQVRDVLVGLGSAYMLLGDEEMAERTLKDYLTLASGDPTADAGHLADATHFLGEIARRRADVVEAERLYRHELGFREKSGASKSDLSRCLCLLAQMLMLRGRHDEAAPLASRAAALAEEVHGPDDPRMLPHWLDVAETQVALGRTEEAEKVLRRGLALAEAVYGGEDLRVADVLVRLAGAYASAGREAETMPLLERVEAIHAHHPDLGPGPKFWLLYLKGRACSAAGKPGEAEEHLSRAIRVGEQTGGADAEALTAARLALAKAYVRGGRTAEAELLYRRILRYYERLYPSGALGLASRLEEYAEILDRLELRGQAARSRARAEAIRREAPVRPSVAGLE